MNLKRMQSTQQSDLRRQKLRIIDSAKLDNINKLA